MLYGGVKGKSVKHLLLGDNTVPSTPPTPIDRGAGTVTTPDGTTVTGTVVPGGGNYKGFIHELFYDPLNIAFDEGTWIPAIGGHSNHVHVSFADPNAALQIMAHAKSLGLRVSENPYVGNVDPNVHQNSSYHYKNFPGSYNGKTLGMAGDFSGSKAAMDTFAEWVKQTYTKQVVTHR